jgi:hypothetical protein
MQIRSQQFMVYFLEISKFKPYLAKGAKVRDVGFKPTPLFDHT